MVFPSKVGWSRSNTEVYVRVFKPLNTFIFSVAYIIFHFLVISSFFLKGFSCNLMHKMISFILSIICEDRMCTFSY